MIWDVVGLRGPVEQNCSEPLLGFCSLDLLLNSVLKRSSPLGSTEPFIVLSFGSVFLEKQLHHVVRFCLVGSSHHPGPRVKPEPWTANDGSLAKLTGTSGSGLGGHRSKWRTEGAEVLML